MNDNAKKWVKALRSGRFKQTTSQLRFQDPHDPETKRPRYCCLGVACELYRREHPEARWEDRDGNDAFFPGGRTRPNDSFLPPRVREWLGLRDKRGAFREDGYVDSLAETNDNGASFKVIADLIESEPKGLFK